MNKDRKTLEPQNEPEDSESRFARQLRQYYGISGESGESRTDMRSRFWKENAPYKVTPKRSFQQELLTQILGSNQSDSEQTQDFKSKVKDVAEHTEINGNLLITKYAKNKSKKHTPRKSRHNNT